MATQEQVEKLVGELNALSTQVNDAQRAFGAAQRAVRSKIDEIKNLSLTIEQAEKAEIPGILEDLAGSADLCNEYGEYASFDLDGEDPEDIFEPSELWTRSYC